MEHIDQHNEGNIGFLYRMLGMYGGVLKPTYGRLLVLKDEKGTNTQGDELKPIVIDISEADNITYSCNKTAKFRSVQASYQDTENANTQTVTVGKGEPVKILSFTYDSKQAATNMANKVYNSTSLDNDTLSLSVAGNPELIAGVPIKINNLRDDIPQDWYIKTASHDISKNGYITSLQLTLKKV